MNILVTGYSNETLAAIISDLSGRRWLDTWSAVRLEELKAEQSRRSKEMP